MIGQSTSLNELPDEVLLKIFKDIPANRFSGKNSIATVCHRWHHLAKDKWLDKRSYNEILASCQKDPQEVFHVLANDVIFRELHFCQIVEIVACNTELAKTVLHDERLTNYDLVNLAKNPIIAASILENSVLCKKVFFDLIKRAKHNPVLGEIITKSEYFLQKIDSPQWFGMLIKLGKNNSTVAQFFIENESIRSRLRPSHWAMLGKNNPAIADAIMKNESLKNQLNPKNWVTLGKNNPTVANAILENKVLLEKFDGNILFNLAINNSAVVQAIMDNNSLLNKLKGNHLIQLGKKYHSMAKLVIESDDLIQRLDDDDNRLRVYLDFREFTAELGKNLAKLAAPHRDIALTVLKTESLRKKLVDWDNLGWNLAILGAQHADVAKAILEDEKLHKALGLGLVELFYDQRKAVIEALMKHPDLLTRDLHLARLREDYEAAYVTLNEATLSSDEMSDLALAHPHLAMLICERKLFRDDLEIRQLLYLGIKYCEFAEYVLKDTKLKNKLIYAIKNKQYGTLGQNALMKLYDSRPVIAQTILKDSTLLALLEEKDVKSLQSIASLGQHIRTLAKKAVPEEPAADKPADSFLGEMWQVLDNFGQTYAPSFLSGLSKGKREPEKDNNPTDMKKPRIQKEEPENKDPKNEGP